MDKREEKRKEEEEEEEKRKEERRKRKEKITGMELLNLSMDTYLGLYGTMSIDKEFEFSFVRKLWEYGSLVLV